MRRACSLAALFSLGLPACSEPAEVPPQVVVVVDTNAPLVGQLAARPDLSLGAAIDTVRVDVLGASGEIVESRELIAPDPADWPLSFGVAARSGSSRVSLRIRGFRGVFSSPETVAGETLARPWTQIAIDRLLEIELPAEGRPRVDVLLDLACLGAPVNFISRRTCVDAAELEGSPELGPSAAPSGLSRAGSSALATEQPCLGAPVEGRVCIPGGLSVLGDPALDGVADIVELDAFPLRPAVLPPFWMDETEVSVGRLRAIVARQGDLQLPRPPRPGTLESECVYSAGAAGELPVNCIEHEAARAICRAEGGDLPTEARWEHAARGRGEGRAFPWGSAYPSCCSASVWRIQCGADSGIEPVASHPGTAECGGDVSRDGVLDLGGSMNELVLDTFDAYDSPCWRGTLLYDPLCDNPETSAHVERGGSWLNDEESARSARRTWTGVGADVGFRCVYEDQP